METTLETQHKLTTNDITFDIRKNVIGDFLCGMDSEDIASKNKIAKRQIDSILASSPRTQALLARSNFASSAIRENARIMELKMNFYDFVDESIQSLAQKENREVTLPILSNIMNDVDKMSRLNIDKPTENKAETTTHIDIAEILKTLKTDDDKLKFLVDNQSLQS